jgi:hypothetical protein
VSTRSASTASALPVPSSAGRHPRTTPTARTMVRASTNSTIDAMNNASTEGAAEVQSIIAGPLCP